MTEAEAIVQVIKDARIENIATVFAAALCVGMVAIGTGSLHSLWGLLILLNINYQKKPGS